MRESACFLVLFCPGSVVSSRTRKMIIIMKMVALLLLAVLPVAVQSASVPSGGKGNSGSQMRRSLLRSISEPDSKDFAVDLDSSNFVKVLKDVSAPWAIVEFFAHWCPACRNYKPHYEKVARLFNGADAAHTGIIFMGRVDCALKINTNLCDKFSVGHYPMLLWGPPNEFTSGHWQPEDGKECQYYRAFSLDDEKAEKVFLQMHNISDSGQILQAAFDIDEATAKAFDIILEHKMIKADTRASLILFLQLLAAHHPSKRCRRGISEMLVNFDYSWPSNLWSIHAEKESVPSGNTSFTNTGICGEEVPHGSWIFCRGSRNDTRGFSCGLWLLLHSLSVRVDDAESHLAFSTICNFIHNFFICEECRHHFYDMCSSVSSPFNTTRDFALWLWKTHNKVNLRLKQEEEDLGTGDPKFPKKVWPSRLLCPACYVAVGGEKNSTTEVEWNEVEVFRFLIDYYGKMIKSSSDGIDLTVKKSDLQMVDDLTTSNAVAVPVGAAVAIALASCAFGALACFWRSQQKNRKQRRSIQ
ncbi:Sulfhydryl oxidase 1 [Nymphaea thermarum]|nr:Sulfhydryl oxidase 1 [Nymphaea thermarum]